jgi:hypothetical protein
MVVFWWHPEEEMKGSGIVARTTRAPIEEICGCGEGIRPETRWD